MQYPLLRAVRVFTRVDGGGVQLGLRLSHFDAAYVKNSEGAPKCDECGGLIKPDVVLYEEGLDENVISKTIHYISQADVLIIGGTSLVVYPAAGLIDYFKGSHLILINKSATQRDSQADLVINDKIGEVFGQL